MPRGSIIVGWFLMLAFLEAILPQAVSAQDITLTPSLVPIGIFFPEDGRVVSGLVKISGITKSNWSLDFSSRDDTTATWFRINQSSESVASNLLAIWDTTQLTDGFYTLRLRIFTQGVEADYDVKVRIQNYSAVETATVLPTWTAVTRSTAVPMSTVPIPSFPTKTLGTAVSVTNFPTMEVTNIPDKLPGLPPNPAILDPKDILTYLGKGMAAVMLAFAFTGLILSLRRK